MREQRAGTLGRNHPKGGIRAAIADQVAQLSAPPLGKIAYNPPPPPTGNPFGPPPGDPFAPVPGDPFAPPAAPPPPNQDIIDTLHPGLTGGHHHPDDLGGTTGQPGGGHDTLPGGTELNPGQVGHLLGLGLNLGGLPLGGSQIGNWAGQHLGHTSVTGWHPAAGSPYGTFETGQVFNTPQYHGYAAGAADNMAGNAANEAGGFYDVTNPGQGLGYGGGLGGFGSITGRDGGLGGQGSVRGGGVGGFDYAGSANPWDWGSSMAY